MSDRPVASHETRDGQTILTGRTLRRVLIGLVGAVFLISAMALLAGWLTLRFSAVTARLVSRGVLFLMLLEFWLNSSRLPDIIVALVYIGLVGFALDRIVATIGHFATRGTARS